MACLRCEQLERDRAQLECQYNAAVASLRASEESPDYQTHWITADGLRMDLEIATLELHMHQKAHSRLM
jgi:hypothetical protein